MIKKDFFSYCLFFIAILGKPAYLFSQGVGIGTSNPNAKAILDLKATDKGVLFPRLSTIQRNAIPNPPDGLHIFNTDDRCLNYYDSANAIWNCYCAGCQTVVINIASNMCKIDFYDLYAKGTPEKKYLINISAGATISGCNPGDTALSFSSMPFDASITINNYGTIEGAGGSGGVGALEQGCSLLSGFAGPGGAGLVGGAGGAGGGAYTGSFGFCAPQIIAGTGFSGTATAGGTGAPGNTGGAAGGTGGGRGQAGQNGTGNLTGFAIGGAAGKAIGGGSGNTVTNFSGGQSFGSVD